MAAGIFLLQKTRVAMPAAKITSSCIWVKDIEAIWIQVKFPTHTTLFSVVYRSELETPNFFENFHGVLEKAWLKTDSIFVLGDLNCCMLEAQNNPGSTLITSKTKNLLMLFEDFNMQSVIAEPTRITYTTKSLIDLIVTTKVDVVRCTGVMPLGISDHCLVFATLKKTTAEDYSHQKL